MRLHEKIGLYGLVLPVIGLVAVGAVWALFERSSRAAPIRTDVIGSTGRVYLADPVCSCGARLDPALKAYRYWDATCPACGREWEWGVDLRETLTGRALRELATGPRRGAAAAQTDPGLADPLDSNRANAALDVESAPSISRVPVRSSALRSVGFDARSSTLEIEFVSGSVYRYFGVSRLVYLGLLSAPSKGQFFNTDIRDAGYRFSRVE